MQDHLILPSMGFMMQEGMDLDISYLYMVSVVWNIMFGEEKSK